MRRDEKQIQGGPEERTGNGEESRSPRPPAGIVISCGVRLSGQAALTNPVNGIPHEPLKSFQKPSIPVGDLPKPLKLSDVHGPDGDQPKYG